MLKFQDFNQNQFENADLLEILSTALQVYNIEQSNTQTKQNLKLMRKISYLNDKVEDIDLKLTEIKRMIERGVYCE